MVVLTVHKGTVERANKVHWRVRREDGKGKELEKKMNWRMGQKRIKKRKRKEIVGVSNENGNETFSEMLNSHMH